MYCDVSLCFSAAAYRPVSADLSLRLSSHQYLHLPPPPPPSLSLSQSHPLLCTHQHRTCTSTHNAHTFTQARTRSRTLCQSVCLSVCLSFSLSLSLSLSLSRSLSLTHSCKHVLIWREKERAMSFSVKTHRLSLIMYISVLLQTFYCLQTATQVQGAAPPAHYRGGNAGRPTSQRQAGIISPFQTNHLSLSLSLSPSPPPPPLLCLSVCLSVSLSFSIVVGTQFSAKVCILG